MYQVEFLARLSTNFLNSGKVSASIRFIIFLICPNAPSGASLVCPTSYNAESSYCAYREVHEACDRPAWYYSYFSLRSYPRANADRALP